MENLPKIVQKAPMAVECKAGKYFWCSCGLSNKQPFCDGSHNGTDFRPVMIELSEPKKLYFCACKKSEKSPLCDGTHNRI